MRTLDDAQSSRAEVWRAFIAGKLDQAELYRVLGALREKWGQALYGEAGLR